MEIGRFTLSICHGHVGLRVVDVERVERIVARERARQVAGRVDADAHLREADGRVSGVNGREEVEAVSNVVANPFARRREAANDHVASLNSIKHNQFKFFYAHLQFYKRKKSVASFTVLLSLESATPIHESLALMPLLPMAKLRLNAVEILK